MKRIQLPFILADLKKKMVFIVGPRQVGKTWIAREIAKSYSRPLYLNYDSAQDRETMRLESWQKDVDLIIFDELHKMRGWRNYIKGVYDTKPNNMHIIVTGSARLNLLRKVGDSLAGRYFVHHILPVSLKEAGFAEADFVLSDFLERGGFPEPLLNKADASRWRALYIENLIRQDVLDFATVDDVRALSDVFELLRARVGSPISYSAISRDVGISPMTVKRYIMLLEELYIVFSIRPYTKKIARAILKEPKIYFYDTGLVVGDDGAKLENHTAVSLLKHALFKKDVFGEEYEVKYLRTKEEKEADFVLTKDTIPLAFYEVKNADKTLSKNLVYFVEKYNIPGIQLVRSLRYDTNPHSNIDVRDAEKYLKSLDA